MILFMIQTLGLAAIGAWACVAGHPTAGGFLIFAAILSIVLPKSDGEK